MTSGKRALLRKIHLWLGVVLGLPFVILSVTGSVLVFYNELDTALNLEFRSHTGGELPGWSSPVWDQALATVKQQWPDRAGQWSFEATGGAAAIPARYYPPSDPEHSAHMHDPEMIWLSLDGRQILREDQWGRYLVTFMYDIHRNFLAGEPGRQFVGWSGFGMLVILISGMVIWWPRGSWKKALSFKRGAVSIRRVRDLHKLFGVWSLLLLFILVLTGSMLALPAERNQFLSWAMTPVTPVPAPVSVASTAAQASITQVLAAGRQAVPDASLAWIDVPGPGTGAFRLRVQVPGDPNSRFPYSFIFIDQYSADVLAVHDARTVSASSTVNNWTRPLHDGSIAGLSTRILAVVAGFVPLVLFITGVLFWMQRRAQSRRKI